MNIIIFIILYDIYIIGILFFRESYMETVGATWVIYHKVSVRIPENASLGCECYLFCPFSTPLSCKPNAKVYILLILVLYVPHFKKA